jgi:hypothetical protein
MKLPRRKFLHLAAAGIGILMAYVVGLVGGAVAQTRPLYPEIADTSHASEQAAAFFHSYFTAKSQHKPAEFMQHFSQEHITYIDGTSGAAAYNFRTLSGFLETFMPKWPDSRKSYSTRIIGDMHSVLVAATDTPELFGGEIRSLAAIDFQDGKIVRYVTYWDSRTHGAEALAKRRPPEDKFPTDFGEKTVGDNASAKIKDVAQSLNAALAGNDAAAAATFLAMTQHMKTWRYACAFSANHQSNAI